MEYGKEMCAMLIIKTGKCEKKEGTELQNQEKIEYLE